MISHVMADKHALSILHAADPGQVWREWSPSRSDSSTRRKTAGDRRRRRRRSGLCRRREINNQVAINVRVLALSHPKPWPTTISPLPLLPSAQSQRARRRALCGSAQHPRQALTTPMAAHQRSGRARLSTANHVETPSSNATGKSLVLSSLSSSHPPRNRPCSSCVLRGQSVSFVFPLLILTCPTGTSAMCYQDGRGPDADSARTDDAQ